MKILHERYLQKYSDWEAGRKSAPIPTKKGVTFVACWGTYTDDTLLVNGVEVKHITVIHERKVESYIVEFDDGTTVAYDAESLEPELRLFRQVGII